MHVDNPHFGFPFQRGVDGHVSCVEQDTPAHVMACENTILRCPTNARLDRPEFGVPLLEYQTVVDEQALVHALMRWEPRSDVRASTVRDYANRAAALITVEIAAQGA